MPLHARLTLCFALLIVPGALIAQSQPYVALDDPDLPMVELLIQRGVVRDPSPLKRPFLVSELRSALDSADVGTATDSALVARLQARWTQAGTAWWRTEARGGADAYSTPRRDLLHPVGDGSAQPYVEVAISAGLGNVVVASRAVAEPRVTDDPDWPGRRNLKIPTRLIDAYLLADFRFARIAYGQLLQNWGPVGMPGIPLSDYGYERQGVILELGTRRARLSALATDLADTADSTGTAVHRYYFLHRLALTLSDKLTLAAWEANVLSGADRNFETRYRNPLSVSYLANTIGLGDRGNVMLGIDGRWRPGRNLTVEGQFGLDDIWIQDRDQNRDRYLFTLAAGGPLGRQGAWRAMYSQVSSLALRTFIPADNFLDAGVGIGRNFSDNDHLKLSVSMPFRARWLISPELALFRQGEGDPRAPYPEGAARAATPTLFIGTVERTFRAAVVVSGSEGPLQVAGDVGVHRVSNAEHVEGAVRTELAFRLRATVGIGTGGRIPE